jgi:hypothetical protein
MLSTRQHTLSVSTLKGEGDLAPKLVLVSVTLNLIQSKLQF